MKHADLGEFLVRAPLYRSEVIEDPAFAPTPRGAELQTPETIRRDCEYCQLALIWDRTAGPSIGRGPDEVDYKCRNCKSEFAVFVRFVQKRLTPLSAEKVEYRHEIEKVGQYPKLEATIPKDFGEALSARVNLYRKGMTSRHSGYGIGALAYFRRLVEDTTDEMLDLLEQAMKDTGADAELLRKLTQARAGTRFEDKVKLAGEVMPPALRPGGVNPFSNLYELLSVGLHELADEECCNIVDDMDRALKFIYTHLKAHTADAKAYETAARGLHEKVQRLKNIKKGGEA